jgi:hypothetical protein
MKTLSEPIKRPTAEPISEPEITWTHTPRIEPGEYSAFCRAAKVYHDRHFKRWVCAVQFDVLTEDLAKVRARVTWFLNMGDKEKPRAGRRGNYWQAWVQANGGSPERKDRLSPRVFQGRYAQIVVADTTKNFRQTTVHGDGAYSVVRELVRWHTGRGKS